MCRGWPWLWLEVTDDILFIQHHHTLNTRHIRSWLDRWAFLILLPSLRVVDLDVVIQPGIFVLPNQYIYSNQNLYMGKVVVTTLLSFCVGGFSPLFPPKQLTELRTNTRNCDRPGLRLRIFSVMHLLHHYPVPPTPQKKQPQEVALQIRMILIYL